MSTKRDSGAGSDAIKATHRTLTRSLTIERFGRSEQPGDQHGPAETTVTSVPEPSALDPGPTRVSRRKYRGWTLASRRYR